jgi:catechol 2,3-dioxygenase-like lactoylglutathione lyase family enzyme
VSLATRPDHVAIAVPSVDDALPRWQDALGGTIQWRFHTPTVFRGAALQFTNGAFLEMLMPSDAEERTRMAGGPSGFVDTFLDRFGTRVHHVTLKVPDLPAAIEELHAAGLDTVDVSLDEPSWQEAFLRPSQIGGLIVQIASSNRANEDWAAMNDHELPGPPVAGAQLLGPQLRHDDLDRAAEVWTLLGGTVTGDDDGLLVSWAGEPLTIAIAPGTRPEAVGLRFAGAAPRPSDPTLGPPVLGRPA